jgi:hypothetical protein
VNNLSIGIFASFIAVNLMVHLDFNLHFSYADVSFGGAFGFPDWYYSVGGLNTQLAVSYLESWVTLNMIKNVFGLLGFLVGRASHQYSIAYVKRSNSNLENKIMPL